jgi:hypothetical protein
MGFANTVSPDYYPEIWSCHSQGEGGSRSHEEISTSKDFVF